MPVVQLHYWAILLAAVAGIAVGSIWYSPLLFSSTWMKLSGKKDMGKMGPNMSLVAVFALVESYVLAHFVVYTSATTIMGGLETGFWLWLGFVATTMGLNYVFGGRSLKLYALDAGNHLLTILVMGAILATWR